VTGAARPSDRLIAADELPLGLIDVALNMPPAELVGDTAVILLRPEQGSPGAVLKVARGSLRAAELRAERYVLAELAIHQGLDDGWRRLLPRILAFDDRTNSAVSVESYRSGTDMADLLARHPNRVEELTAAALRAIAPLHRGTSTSPVDTVYLSPRWVLEPLSRLEDMCQRLDPTSIPAIERLAAVLRQAMVGCRIPVGWTHGDYRPANVRVAGTRGPVTGIVDWRGAQLGRPAFIDEYLMILTASSQVERTDLGAVVADRVRAGGFLNRERSALRAPHGRTDPAIGNRERIDERIAILLTWLHHAADSWRTCATHPNHHGWWAANVAPVLDAFATWHGLEVKARA
jgi:hypothetical protein